MVNRQVFSGLDQRILGEQRNPSEVQIRHDTAGNVLVDVPDPPQLTIASPSAAGSMTTSAKLIRNPILASSNNRKISQASAVTTIPASVTRLRKPSISKK